MSSPGNTITRAKALLPLTPLTALRVSRHQTRKHGLIPNTTISHKPLIIYHGAFPAPTPSAQQIEAHINAVGACRPMWRFPFYSEDHFHTTSHEFVVVWRGRARVNFGGEGCPGVVIVELARGDAVLIPAGVSHRTIEDLKDDGDYEMVGSYPPDSEHWDMCYGKPGEEEHIASIKDIAWFTRDPLYSDGGPAVIVL